jgi:hypothetical protein
VIDGKIDEAAWDDAAWTDDFVDIEGDVKPRPRIRTRAKMLWDDRFFYVAAELSEPNVWATLTKHDSVIFHDNDFEMFIDPNGDNHEYYEIELNALNTEWDLFLKKPYRDGGPAINEWEIPGLKTATHVFGTLNDPTDRDIGWTVELAIPWSALAEYARCPTPPRDGDQWRVNFSRVEWEVVVEGKKTTKVPNKREDNWVWSPQGAIDMHRPERWGFVQFSTAVPGQSVFRPSSSWDVRDRLMRVYWAQRQHKAKKNSWASSPEALGLDGATPIVGAGPLQIRLTETGYEASITCEGPPRQTLTVREDSRLSATARED